MKASQSAVRWPGAMLLLALFVLSFLAPKRWDSATLEEDRQGLAWVTPEAETPEPIPLGKENAGSESPAPFGSKNESVLRDEAQAASEPPAKNAPAEPVLASPKTEAAKADPAPQPGGEPAPVVVQLVPAAPEPVVQAAALERPLVAPEPQPVAPAVASSTRSETPQPVQPGGTLELARPVATKVPQVPKRTPQVPEPEQTQQTAWAAAPGGLKRYLEAAAAHGADPRLLEQVARCCGEIYQRVRRGEEIVELCEQLRHLHGQLLAQADAQSRLQAATALRRLAHAVARRRALWLAVARLHRWQRQQEQLAQLQQQRLVASALQLQQSLREAGADDAWQRFLLLPELTRAETLAPEAEEGRWQQLVRSFLERVATLRRDPRYDRLPQWEQLQQVQRQLCACALARFRVAQLPEMVEQFEQTEEPIAQHALVEFLQLAEHGAEGVLGPDHRELINHWNNTNLRVAVHNRLLAQLVPQAPPRWQQVYDTILGIPVRGRSWTATRVHVRTLPGPGARLVIAARGLVRSWTRASQGIVTTHERTVARFSARRLVQLRPEGLRSWPTQLDLQARSELDELETELDGVPLLGDLVREIALSRREELLPEAQAEARWKLRQRIQEQFDRQVDQALAALDRKRVARLNQLRKRLRLDPVLLAHTTPQRLVLRMRLAGPDQLGAHTPRPRALAGSWASLQVHQSAINNVLDRLQLAGRQFTLPELERHLQTMLDLPIRLGEEKDRRAVVQFAQQQPVRVQLHQGEVRLHLRLARLATPRRSWRNLNVQVRYRPVRQGRWYYLQRTGYVELSGQLRSLGDELVVRGIFNRIFHRQRRWPLYPPAWRQDRQMNHLALTQCVIQDGWLGLSLGPAVQLSVAEGSTNEARPR